MRSNRRVNRTILWLALAAAATACGGATGESAEELGACTDLLPDPDADLTSRLTDPGLRWARVSFAGDASAQADPPIDRSVAFDVEIAEILPGPEIEGLDRTTSLLSAFYTVGERLQGLPDEDRDVWLGVRNRDDREHPYVDLAIAVADSREISFVGPCAYRAGTRPFMTALSETFPDGVDLDGLLRSVMSHEPNEDAVLLAGG
jgi:hypothetical protein